MSIRIKIISYILLLLLGANLLSDAALAATKNSQSSYDTLVQKVRAKGRLRVIIQAAEIIPIESSIKNKIDREFQRRKISDIQDKILGQITAPTISQLNTRRFKTIPYLVVEVDLPTLTKIRQSPDVALVSEDVLMRPTLATSGPVVGADKVAGMGFDGHGFTVAIIDTGVDTSHPFLHDGVVHEACFSTTSTLNGSFTVCPDGTSTQIGIGAGVNCDVSIIGCDHGTHVAGIAVGKGSSFSGMAPAASFMSIQVFSRFTGLTCTSAGFPTPCILSYISDQLLALEHIYLNKDVYKVASINMSLGGGYYTNQLDCDFAYPAAKAMFDNLRASGIAAIAAAGNDGYTDALGAPACISSVISVGATNNTDSVSSFSNSAPYLTLLAPGSNINSSIPGGGFAAKSGTSMATPHVSGAWADLKSKWPEASVDEILSAFTTLGNSIMDSRNGLVKPRMQIDSASAMYKRLYHGFNLTGINPSPTVVDTYTLLESIGDMSVVSKLDRYNRTSSIFESLIYDFSGIPVGTNGIMDPGEGWITYSKSEKLLRNYVEYGCNPTAIVIGVNIISFPCIHHKITAKDLLSIANDPMGLFLVQGFDYTTGKLQTVILTSDGNIFGDDFQLYAGESYVLQARSNLTIPSLE